MGDRPRRSSSARMQPSDQSSVQLVFQLTLGFLRDSYEILTRFLRDSYEILTRFLRDSRGWKCFAVTGIPENSRDLGGYSALFGMSGDSLGGRCSDLAKK